MSNEALFEVIGDQKWLESAADPIAKAIHNLFPVRAGKVQVRAAK